MEKPIAKQMLYCCFKQLEKLDGYLSCLFNYCNHITYEFVGGNMMIFKLPLYICIPCVGCEHLISIIGTKCMT